VALNSLRTAAVAASILVVGGAAAAEERAAEAPETVEPGAEIPAFEAEALDGSTVEVRFEGRSTVLVFFLSSCPTCHKMIPEWNRAFERRPDGLQVFGVMLDREPPGFFMTTPVRFPVLRAPTRRFASDLGVKRVPFTIRVGADGKVENAHQGILDPISLGEYFRP
jgi:peroxiredoxin